MPFEVVRGSMLIRANSLLRYVPSRSRRLLLEADNCKRPNSGHSAIRWSVLETLVSLINHDILPVIPLRGSISASGDLSPLSYIAGALTGHPDVKVRIVRDGREQILPSPEALALYNITPVSLQAKEGLAVLNGTAVSASFASIVLHDSHFLHLLSQVGSTLFSLCRVSTHTHLSWITGYYRSHRRSHVWSRRIFLDLLPRCHSSSSWTNRGRFQH